MTYDWVSFTTDYGTADGFVAACKGVLGRLAPDVRVIDVTHQVPAQDVRRGAAVLAQTAPWLPPAVHLAVVDPGVGTQRRGIAVVTGHGILVGPDNGLLPPAADALGGSTAAYELADPAFHLPRVSTTFHGRDVFAPVAARLCLGLDPAALGPPVDELVRLPVPAVHIGPGRLGAEVLTVDVFGNVQLAAGAADLAAADLGPDSLGTGLGAAGPDRAGLGASGLGFADLGPADLGPDSLGPADLGPAGLGLAGLGRGAADPAGGRWGEAGRPGPIEVVVGDAVHPARMGRTFGDVSTGELVVIVDSEDLVGIAVNQGNAAARLGLESGDQVTLRTAPPAQPGSPRGAAEQPPAQPNSPRRSRTARGAGERGA
jgi:S-adenosyl-L-methionine hydrolase (adenosine-forming)